MSWIISNWRLKLLALALTLGLLAAVAFSENPVAVATVPAAVDYDNLDPSLAIINPVLRTPVTVFGPAAATTQLQTGPFPNGVRFRVDLKGFNSLASSHTFYAIPKSLPAGITWTGDQVPITVGVDRLVTRSLDIQARPLKIAPGFKVTDAYAYCTNSAQRCPVQVTAPASVVDGLVAYVETEVQSSTSVDSPNQPVRFEKDGKPFDMAGLKDFPLPRIDPSVVNVKVTAQQTQVTRQVALRPSVTGRPACGYAITGITFAPDAFVSVTGPADRLAGLDSITLPTPIDVGGATATVRVNEQIPTDNYTVAPTSVAVSVGIARQADCSAATPTPSPSPSPTR